VTSPPLFLIMILSVLLFIILFHLVNAGNGWCDDVNTDDQTDNIITSIDPLYIPKSRYCVKQRRSSLPPLPPPFLTSSLVEDEEESKDDGYEFHPLLRMSHVFQDERKPFKSEDKGHPESIAFPVVIPKVPSSTSSSLDYSSISSYQDEVVPRTLKEYLIPLSMLSTERVTRWRNPSISYISGDDSMSELGSSPRI
jgi:hypothetical protein